MNDRFQIVGARPLPEAAPTKNRHSLRGKPVASAMILSLIVLGCLFCELIMTKAPAYLDLAHCSTAPCREFLFGTDTMGRDIFSMIWYGGGCRCSSVSARPSFRRCSRFYSARSADLRPNGSTRC